MTTNHHTPISVGAPANATTFNSPLGQLDSAIDTATTNLNNLKAGADGFSQLSLTTSTTLTISSGQITVTRSRHLVDTEASASWDDLDTIDGGVAGDVLVLQSVTSARVVVVRHNTGNIFLNGMDVYLDRPRKALTLLHDGTQWVLIGDPPQRIDRRQARVLFFDGTVAYDGHPAVGINGTASAVLEAEAPYTLYTSTASIGGTAGVAGNTLNQFQVRHNPSLTVWLKTGNSVADIRWYLGFRSGGIYGAADNLASTGENAVVFRFSTVAGDAGFRPVTCNGTTQTVGSVIGTVTANTVYKLQVAIFNGVAYFAVNDGVPVVVSATIPASTQNLGWMAHLQSQAASAKTVLMRQVVLEVN